jgi:predicted DNA-binding transcriptional regulator AlpA
MATHQEVRSRARRTRAIAHALDADTKRRELPREGKARLPQVLSAVPVSASTLWRWVREGRFPQPSKLSARVTAWDVRDVREWLATTGGAR